MKENDNRKSKALLALYAMIITAALVLTVFGGRVYAALSAGREENAELRSATSYLQNKLAAADREGGIIISEGPEGALLRLPEGDSGYETRIYLYEGRLLEELSREGSELAPQSAQAICEAESFSFELLSERLARLKAGESEALVYIRSEGGIALE
ncbi:MAG: DUF4860 domain-containing protein [Oscillospiraceae bacterium]|nr:DUF4860 domain-containing protein [Oscillospiraceae bacterium]